MVLVLVTPKYYWLYSQPTTYTGGVFIDDCPYDPPVYTCHNNSRLTDGVTNEGSDFNLDNFMGWDKSFGTWFFFETLPPNFYFTHIDIYYYHNPSLGYGLPIVRISPVTSYLAPIITTNNSQVSQSDNDVIKISLSMLIPSQIGLITLGFTFVSINPLYSKIQPVLATQFLMSEIKFFADTGNYTNDVFMMILYL